MDALLLNVKWDGKPHAIMTAQPIYSIPNTPVKIDKPKLSSNLAVKSRN